MHRPVGLRCFEKLMPTTKIRLPRPVWLFLLQLWAVLHSKTHLNTRTLDDTLDDI